MLYGKELDEALTVLPPYDPDIIHTDAATRLVAMSDIYRVFLSNAMSREIYSKLYLGLLRSLQKKESPLMPRQFVENQKAIQMVESSGIIGGADSFTIIGPSGIGKSTSINRSIQLLSKTPIIVTEKPYRQIIPCVMVQCPFDSSVKGLLLEILRAVDAKLGSDYCAKALHSRNTTVDTLIGSVSSVCINHVGLLVIDEIQHIVGQKAGDALARCLMQLINSSGISIALVGTPSVIPFLSDGEFQLARRTLGLYYEPMEYGQAFRDLCTALWRYQYVKNRAELDEPMMHWLYEHSSGNPSVLVSLLHDAQECSILDGREKIGYDPLQAAYHNRLRMLHPHITPTRKPSTSRVMQSTPALYAAVEELITQHGVEVFYVGNQGAFDAYVRSALRQLQEKHPRIRYAVVLAYMPGRQTAFDDFSDTMLPEGIEEVHPRYAVNWRNRWMLRQSQYVICYIHHHWGGAAKYVQMALRQGKTVINLCDNGVLDGGS